MEQAKKKRIGLRIPNKLSALLRAAVADMAAVENDPRYKLNMSDWHVPYGGVCEVCMAGAVLAMRSNAEPGEMLRPWRLERVTEATSHKMKAINDMREGGMRAAAEEIGLDALTADQVDALGEAKSVIRKNLNHSKGYASSSAYLKAADILQAAGL